MPRTKGRKPNIVTPRGLRGMKTGSGKIKYYSNEYVGGKRVKLYWGYDPKVADQRYLAHLAAQAPQGDDEDEEHDPETEEEYLKQQIQQNLVRIGYTAGHLQAFLNANKGDLELTAEAVHQKLMTTMAQRHLSEAGRELKYLRRGQKPGPKSDIKTVLQMGEAWKCDKEGMHPVTFKQYRSAWQQMCDIIGGNTRVEDLDKAAIRKYREKVRKLAKGSPNYVTSRFRKVKAIFNHVLTEYDVEGVTDEFAAVVRASFLSLLRQETGTSSSPRPIARDELHALLSACDHLAHIDVTALRAQLPTLPKGSPEHQSVIAQINKAEQNRLLGIQFRAIYLTALNLAFYPIDIARLPRSAVNVETGEVVFPRVKKKTVRVGVLFHETQTAIGQWLQHASGHGEYLFINSQGGQWNRNQLARNLNRHKATSTEMGTSLPADLTFSAFRDGAQTAAQLGLATKGSQVDERLIAILAGHSIGISDHYILRNPSMMRPLSAYIRDYYFGETAGA